MQETRRAWWREYSIWLFAFGYFACYVPYSLTAKSLSKGLFASTGGKSVAGFSLLPISGILMIFGMLAFITVMGWWQYASSTEWRGMRIVHPTRWTFLSGICTALIIATTTLAYTFEGVSIVFAMLLMRGGVLILAPIVDALSGRKVRWFAWGGLGCAMCALLVSLMDTSSYHIPVLCAIDIGVYLASYFVRFRFMSRLAKSDEPGVNLRYFVEEQMVATPILFVMLGVAALIGQGDVMLSIRQGFTTHWGEPYLWWILLLGAFSQGTGIFGSLILLDKRENTFCVPVNRSSSIMAGVLASTLLYMLFGQRLPGTSQLLGAGFIVVAILFLSIPPALAKRRQKPDGPEASAGA